MGADSDRFVTIVQLYDPVRAEVLRDLLAQEGIEATIAGSNHSALFGQMGAFVEIRLQVLKSHAARATEIIEALDEEDDVEIVDPAEASMFRTADHADPGDPDAIRDGGPGPYREGPAKTALTKKHSTASPAMIVAALLLLAAFAALALL